MINAKKIYNEMLNDSVLVEMVGEDSIMDSYPDEVVKFPCVIFTDSLQTDIEFGDNQPHGTECYVDVHIFTKALDGFPTTTEIGLAVNNIFHGNDFFCTSNSELEEGNGTKHRVMKFKNEFFS